MQQTGSQNTVNHKNEMSITTQVSYFRRKSPAKYLKKQFSNLCLQLLQSTVSPLQKLTLKA